MSVCMYMCVCMYVCIYVCTYVYMYVCAYVCMYVYTYDACMSAWMPLTGKSCSVFVSWVTCMQSCLRVLPGSWPLTRARVLLLLLLPCSPCRVPAVSRVP